MDELGKGTASAVPPSRQMIRALAPEVLARIQNSILQVPLGPRYILRAAEIAPIIPIGAERQNFVSLGSEP